MNKAGQYRTLFRRLYMSNTQARALSVQGFQLSPRVILAPKTWDKPMHSVKARKSWACAPPSRRCWFIARWDSVVPPPLPATNCQFSDRINSAWRLSSSSLYSLSSIHSLLLLLTVIKGILNLYISTSTIQWVTVSPHGFFRLNLLRLMIASTPLNKCKT